MGRFTLSPSIRDTCTVAEAAHLLGVNRATVTRWIDRGILPALTKLPGIRGAYLLDAAQVAAFAADAESIGQQRAYRARKP